MLCTVVLYLQRLQNHTKELNIASGARRVGEDFDIEFTVLKIDSVLLLESSSEHGGVIPAQEEHVLPSQLWLISVPTFWTFFAEITIFIR